MKKLPSLALAVLGGLCLLVGVARAQTTGVITGHVVDANGLPLRGIRVEAVSATQIGGARTAFSDDEGGFQFPALTPGSFQITASAPKLKKMVIDKVRVSPGKTTDVDVLMEVETEVERIRIVERSPTVNTGSAAVGESFDADFIDQLPLSSRSYQGVAALAPGVTDFFGTGNPSIRGGTDRSNTYTVDGFQTTDPVSHTFGTNFSFDAMAAVEVQTAAYGAEWSSTTGGLTNIVTKSGSNRLEVDGTVTYTDQHLQFFRDARDIGQNRQTIASLNIGGPIVKDRLWFYASLQAVNSTFTLPRDPLFPDHPPRSVLAFDGIGKITWQVNPRHKLELKATFSPADFQNTSQSYLVEPEAETRRRQDSRFIGASWQALLTDHLVLNVRAGFNDQRFRTDPQSCRWDPEHCGEISAEIDVVTDLRRKNASLISRSFNRNWEQSGSLEWYKDSRKFGAHAVKLGVRAQEYYNARARTVTGDSVLLTVGSEPFSVQNYCGNDPKLANGECRSGWVRTEPTGREAHIFLQDAWKPTRYVTIVPGLALHSGHSQDDQERIVTDITAFTPHLQATWDPTHDGRTVIRGSFSNYVDTGFLELAQFTGRSLYSKTCDWDPEAKAYIRNCRASGGSSATTVGLPCGPDGVGEDGTSCLTRLRAPRTWEYTLGAEREITTGVSLGADLIYRKFNHQWEDLETNGNWNQGGTDLRRDGRWKTGRSEFIFDLETPDEARRRYVGLTTSLRKRQGLLRVIASYTWSRYEGTEDSDFATMFLDNPGQNHFYYGPLPVDFRHNVKLQATYQIRPWVSAGVIYEFVSGRPYNRYHFDPTYQSFSAFRTKRGYDTRGTLNPDDDTALRTPDISALDLQARFSLRQLTKQNIDLFVDILNIMALRTTTDVIETDGPFWSRPARRLPPTRARFGLRYRF